MVGRKSSATVQQMQPLASSTMSSSPQVASPQPSSSSRSMPISPNSLTMSAMRRPMSVAQQVPDQAGLAGAEKAGEHGRRNLGEALHQRSIARLEVERQAGGHENHDIGLLGNPLVQPSGVLDEGARHGIGRHDAEPDLVRRPAPAARPRREQLEQARAVRLHRPLATIRLVSHRVRQSTRTAWSGAAFGGAARRPDRAAPRPCASRVAPRAVLGDARRHLGVERLRRSRHRPAPGRSRSTSRSA